VADTGDIAAERIARVKLSTRTMVGGSVAVLVILVMLRFRRIEATRLRAFGREYQTIHEAVRLEPESVWDRLRAFLCSDADHYEQLDLVEDLMFWHPDEFIERLTTVSQECPRVRELIVAAEVGGRAITPGLAQFHELQAKLDASIG
jgi:hypothetical protein